MLPMQLPPPGITADDVLQTFQNEGFTLFLGAAIATTGLIAAAFAAIRRKRASLLVYFALFAHSLWLAYVDAGPPC